MHESHPLGTVAQLWRYPVKGLAPEPLERTAVDARGLAGDRNEALFVSSPGHTRTGRTYRGKENNLLHTAAGIESATRLAAERHLDVELRDGGPHFDAGVVSIVVDRWVAELDALLGFALDPLRFRPNLFLRADPRFALGEADLVGRQLTAGDLVLDVVATIKRCVTTTYDIVTGEPNPAVLRATAQHRGNVMGIYCDVRRAATLVRGDAMWLVPDGATLRA